MRRPTVFFTIRDLPEVCRPALIVRTESFTMVTLHSDMTLAQGTEVAVMSLTPEEQQVVRDAFGEPPIGQPVSDMWLSDEIRIDLGFFPDSLLTLHARKQKQAQASRMLEPS